MPLTWHIRLYRVFAPAHTCVVEKRIFLRDKNSHFSLCCKICPISMFFWLQIWLLYKTWHFSRNLSNNFQLLFWQSRHLHSLWTNFANLQKFYSKLAFFLKIKSRRVFWYAYLVGLVVIWPSLSRLKVRGAQSSLPQKNRKKFPCNFYAVFDWFRWNMTENDEKWWKKLDVMGVYGQN
jgi:hypothetical protein